MLQFQRQGKLDEAVQVAMQILQTSSRGGQAPTARATVDSDAARTAAIGVLARSGRLSQLIQRAQSELEKTPNSVAIHQRLADYYTAARDNDKAAAEQAKISELRPDDTALRLQVALKLARSGKIEPALEQYEAAIKKDPAIAARSLAQFETTLLQAGRADALVSLLEQDRFAPGRQRPDGRPADPEPARNAGSGRTDPVALSQDLGCFSRASVFTSSSMFIAMMSGRCRTCTNEFATRFFRNAPPAPD